MEYHQLSDDHKKLADAVVKDFNSLDENGQQWFVDHAHLGNHTHINNAIQKWAPALVIPAGVITYFVKQLIRKFPR